MSSDGTSDVQKCPVASGSGHSRPEDRPRARLGRRRTPTGLPVYTEDLYSVSAIEDPYPHYRAMRELGPVVWLEKQRMYALPRYAEVKQVLADDATYRSSGSVAMNPVARRVGNRSFLMSDDDAHVAQRKVAAHRLTPRALRPMRADVDAFADKVVRAAVADRYVDGVEDIAMKLPMTVVPDLIGWPQRGRKELVKWAGAIFDMLGPLNGVSVRSTVASLRMLYFVHSLARRRDVVPGSIAEEMIEHIDAGRLRAADLPAFLMDYLGPSIDTTVSGIAAALWLFAENPDQWELLRRDPDALLPNAINEVIRIESPLRAFARRAETDSIIGGVPVPVGSQLLVMYASANRDELVWDEPDRFDITRDASAHVGFGYGVHGCAGQGLSRMETEAILRALLRHVDRIESAGTPRIAVNNVIHRFSALPLRLVPISN
ncbi:cytochrome P450 [Rhodococcoides fascians]|uniref:cytochrome P450 n=1 Tax=Rhodococcoides fascians TaxID=1828 RepID=UPI000B1DD8CF|nr:cytochrome P450 [Rhodococcus fascians]